MKLTRRSFNQGAACASASSLLPSLSAFAAQRKNAGLVLGPGPDGRCDDAKIGGPFVSRVRGGAWRMYYYCRSKKFPDGVAPAFGTGSIAMATSDDGLNWSRHDGPLEGGAIMAPSTDEGAFDSQHIGLGGMLRDGDDWIMSYFGGDDTVPTEIAGAPVPEGYQYKGYRCRPGIARSKDGLTWERVRGAGPGGAAVDIGENLYGAFPTIIKTEDEYLLYYTTLSPKIYYWDTRIASSKDLVNWKDRGSMQWAHEALSWETGGMVTRNIIANPRRRGKKWMMVYTALDANYRFYTRKIGIADSDDGLVWTQRFADPIFIPAEINQWDGGGVAYAQIVQAERNYHLYYYGFAHTNNKLPPGRGIGAAVSNGNDLRSFKRVVL